MNQRGKQKLRVCGGQEGFLERKREQCPLRDD